jgi:ubiquinone biosynthesis protein COQ4
MLAAIRTIDTGAKFMAEVPYLFRGVSQIATDSSVMISSSKYLNNARLREWIAMIALRKNGPDMPPPAEMHELLGILDELRDYDQIEEQFRAERKVNPALDAWFEAGHVSTYKIDDFKDYAPGTLGGIFYKQMTAGDYEVQIVPWSEPKSQLEFFNLRSGQTHDLEHILTGGGFNFMGELVPYWCRLTNVPRFFHDKHLATEVNLIQIFGSLRYTMRTSLHYPEVWETAIGCIQRGIKVGQESDALFMQKIEDAFHLPLEEARAALRVRGAVDIDTSREGAFWGGQVTALVDA